MQVLIYLSTVWWQRKIKQNRIDLNETKTYYKFIKNFLFNFGGEKMETFHLTPKRNGYPSFYQ